MKVFWWIFSLDDWLQKCGMDLIVIAGARSWSSTFLPSWRGTGTYGCNVSHAPPCTFETLQTALDQDLKFIRSDLNQPQQPVLSPGSKWKPCFYFEGLPRLGCMRLESLLSWCKINVGRSIRLSVFNHSCWPAAEQFWICKCKCLCHFSRRFCWIDMILWCEP